MNSPYSAALTECSLRAPGAPAGSVQGMNCE